MKRTHTCGELTKEDLDKDVILQGWVDTRRDHGGVIFIDLRDRYGLTQIVFNPDVGCFNEAEKLRREYVIEITGKVVSRKEGMENPKMKTGQIEIITNNLKILNTSEVPPIEIDDRIAANDEIRLKYRYLDLRRPIMQKNILIRHQVAQAIREYLNSKGLLEIQTPMMVRSTPEGSRDYVVPSRLHPGKFFALPQSPQLYKQTLMVSGFDRYYQLPVCCRDEGNRADRQPEHQQIDIEMSFVDEEDIYELIEGMYKHIFKKVINKDIKVPFDRLTYDEAMDKYGSDKPDLRFGLELVDVSEIVVNSDFSVFKSAVNSGGMVKCINAKDCAKFSRKDIDELTKLVAIYRAKGLAWMKLTKEGLESSVVKFFNADVQQRLINATNAKEGDLLLFVADTKKITNSALGALRIELAKRLELTDPKEYRFAWIHDFPLFAWNEEEEKWDAEHHIFTMPKEECMQYLDTDPSKVIGRLYDLTLNGWEMASGSIRIHLPEIQKKVFKVLGITDEEVELKFGWLINAFKYGAPPHGGIAPGLDRTVAMMLGLNDIREVIAFPKNKAQENPMDGSPNVIDESLRAELKIQIDKKVLKKSDKEELGIKD
ncbi:aspartate--tRNA ligase [Nanoarchaeota archaeon]